MPKSSRKINLDQSWLDIIGDEFDKPYMVDLRAFLKEQMKTQTVYPPAPLIFNALNTTPFDQVKVVILGQDPYHGQGQAHGLCFSVQQGIQPPPSLVNIFTEMNRSLGIPYPHHGDLSRWAQQGVLLLNTTLTVQAGKPKSHAGKGWELFTDRIIRELSDRRQNLIFVLWGSHAKSKEVFINKEEHLVLKAPHPSPYSASNGFFGCNHFLLINEYLNLTYQAAIDWQL